MPSSPHATSAPPQAPMMGLAGPRSTSKRGLVVSSHGLSGGHAPHVVGAMGPRYAPPHAVLRAASRVNRLLGSAQAGAASARLSDWTHMRQAVFHTLFGNIPPTYTMRQKIGLVLAASAFGRTWDFFQTVISVVACIFYIMTTYGAAANTGFDAFITLLFTIDYILRLYSATRRCAFVCSFFACIDVLTCLPVYIEWGVTASGQFGPSSNGVSFLRFVRILRLLRILRSFKLINSALSVVTKQILQVALVVLSMIFLMAGAINLLESGQLQYDAQGNAVDSLTSGLYYDIMGFDAEAPLPFDFANSFYFSVVTVATVGYGDFHPKTEPGKLLCVLFIITAVIIIPMQVQLLGDVLSAQSRYLIKYVPEDEENCPHVLVVGGAEQSDLVLQEFFAEFFHPDRREGTDERFASRQVVIMGPGDPSESLRRLMTDSAFDGRIVYVRGSPLSPEDLQRVSADKAEACFVLSDVMARDPIADDRSVALRALMIAAHAPKSRLFVHIGRPEGLASFYSSGGDVHEVLCIQEWKTCLLAQTAVVPGFSTLLSNLLRASSRAEDDEIAEMEAWVAEYNLGTSMELYPVNVPEAFDGQPFTVLASEVYRITDGNVIVCGVRDPDIPADSAAAQERLGHLSRLHRRKGTMKSVGVSKDKWPLRGPVVLNPGPDYRLQAFQIMYVLAESDSTATDVTLDEVWRGVSLPPPLSTDMRCLGYGPRRGQDPEAAAAAAAAEVAAEFADHNKSGLSAAAAQAAAEDAAQRARELAVASQLKLRPKWSWEENQRQDDRNNRWFYRFSKLEPAADHVHAVDEVEAVGTLNDIVGVNKKTDGPAAAPTATATAEAADTASPTKGRLWKKLSLHVKAKMADKAKLDPLNPTRQRRLTETADDGEGDDTASFSVFANFASIVEASNARMTTLKRFTFDSVADLVPAVKGHIIVCSTLRGFKGFLPPLRSAHVRGTALQKQVVLLTQYDDSNAAHDSIEEISYFASVAVVIGQPSNPADLVRAGIGSASCLMLLSEQENSLTIDGEALDAGVIFNYLVLEQVLSSVATSPNFYVIVELLTMGNLHVLNSKRLAKLVEMRKVAQQRLLDSSQPLQVSPPPPSPSPANPGPAGISWTSSSNHNVLQPGAAATAASIAGSGAPSGATTASSTVTSNASLACERDGGSLLSPRGVDVESGGGNGGGGSSGSGSGNGGGGGNEDSAPSFGSSVTSQSLKKLRAALGFNTKRAMMTMSDSLLAPIGRDGGSASKMHGADASWSMLLGEERRQLAMKRARRGVVPKTGGIVNNDVFTLPFYMAGYAFPMDTLHTLLVAAYFNPEISRFAEQLLLPDPGHGSRLIVEPLPRRFHGMQFRELFSEMIERYDAVVVGLYRSRLATGAPLPYVYMAPAAACPLFSTDEDEDLMYVFAQQPLFVGANAKAPHELAGMETIYDVQLYADPLASGTLEAAESLQRRQTATAKAALEAISASSRGLVADAASLAAAAADASTLSGLASSGSASPGLPGRAELAEESSAAPSLMSAHIPAQPTPGLLQELQEHEQELHAQLPGTVTSRRASRRRASQLQLESLAASLNRDAPTAFGGGGSGHSLSGTSAVANATLLARSTRPGPPVQEHYGSKRRVSLFVGSDSSALIQSFGEAHRAASLELATHRSTSPVMVVVSDAAASPGPAASPGAAPG